MADHDDNKPIDFRIDATNNDDGAEIDAGTIVPALVFGDIPLIGPDWKIAAVQSAANFAQRLAGAENFLLTAIVNNQTTALQVGSDEDLDETYLAFRASMDIVEQDRERQRERDEEYWADREIDWGDYHLTGSEWKAVAELMSSEVFRRSMRERGKAEGWTDEDMEEAETLAPQIAAALARGQKPTPEQEDMIKSNPALKAWLDDSAERALSARFDIDTGLNTDASNIANQSGVSAISEGTNILAADKGLAANVKPIAPVYSALAAGTAFAVKSPSPDAKPEPALSNAQADMGLNF